VIKRRAGQYVKFLDSLTVEQITAIINEAEALVTTPKPAKVYKRAEPMVASSSDVEVIDEDTDNYGDEDNMDEDIPGSEEDDTDENKDSAGSGADNDEANSGDGNNTEAVDDNDEEENADGNDSATEESRSSDQNDDSD